MPLLLKISELLVFLMRFELFQELLFVILDILDESMSRLVLLFLLIKIVRLVYRSLCVTDTVEPEHAGIFLSEFFHLLPVPLLLHVINDLELRILTDYERLWCNDLLGHSDPILECLLDIRLYVVHEPLELVRPCIVIVRLLVRLLLLPDQLIQQLILLIDFLLIDILLLLLLLGNGILFFLLVVTHIYYI